MTKEEFEYILKHINEFQGGRAFYEEELKMRKAQERFIKSVPSYVPDKGVWVRTGDGVWRHLEDKFCGNEVKRVVMLDSMEEAEKLMEKVKERSHKIAEIKMIQEYKVLKPYVLLEFYDYLKRQNDTTIGEVTVDLATDIIESDKDTMLHKLRKAKADVFLLLLDKIMQTYPRLTDKSLATEVAEIIEGLDDVNNNSV